MASWQYEAQRANLSTVTLLSDPPRYEFRGEGITYGPFLYDEADAFVAGLRAAKGYIEPDTCAKQPPPIEADTASRTSPEGDRLMALGRCLKVLDDADVYVDAGALCDARAALFVLFSVPPRGCA